MYIKYINVHIYISTCIHIYESSFFSTGASPVGGHAKRDRGSGSGGARADGRTRADETVRLLRNNYA